MDSSVDSVGIIFFPIVRSLIGILALAVYCAVVIRKYSTTASSSYHSSVPIFVFAEIGSERAAAAQCPNNRRPSRVDFDDYGGGITWDFVSHTETIDRWLSTASHRPEAATGKLLVVVSFMIIDTVVPLLEPRGNERMSRIVSFHVDSFVISRKRESYDSVDDVWYDEEILQFC